MFEKIYTSKQLSLFFQIGVFFNILALLLNILLYRYTPESIAIKFTTINLSNVSLVMISTILISQIILYILKKYKKYIEKYTSLSITILIIINTFLFLILKLDSKIQEKFIIFFSNLSRIQYNHKTLYIVLCILLMLIINLYQNFKYPKKINSKNVFTIIYDIYIALIRRYLIIFLTLFTIFNIKQLTYFQSNILNYSASFFLHNLKFLKTAIPISWVFIISYYIYQRFFKNNHKK